MFELQLTAINTLIYVIAIKHTNVILKLNNSNVLNIIFC